MKPDGYWLCRNEIRNHYGADLYKECYADVLREVMELSN